MSLRQTAVAGLLTALVSAPGWAVAEPADQSVLAIEVVGDLETADRIAVVVPGAGTRADRMDRIDQPAGMARALVAEAARADPETQLAAVAWAGYHAPDGLSVGVIRGEYAAAGAELLGPYLRELADQYAAPIGLFCFSYGSVVCGQTDLPPAVSDLTVFGSPGLGAGVDSVDDLSPVVRVWAARASGDWVRFVPSVRIVGLGHGPDPTDPTFGARVVATGTAHEHSDYAMPGTASLRNLARIAVEDLDAVTCAPGIPGGACRDAIRP